MASTPQGDRSARRATERAAVARQRRIALLGAGAVGVIAVGTVIALLVGSGGESGSSPSPEAAAEPPACPQQVAGDPRLLVGQKLVVRMDSTATEELRGRVRRGEIAGVILFPAEGTDPQALAGEIAKLQAAARAGEMPTPVIAIDQEGGEVERLPELPPDISPAELASTGRRAAAGEGEATAAALAQLGINVDLAPVLDVAETESSFIASRAFGSDPSEVVSLGVAFGEGLQREGVAATAKHFPGLGLAAANTDDEPSTIDATEAELEPGLEPFRAAVEAGFELIMAANAVYPAYDDRLPASLSPKLIDGVLRTDLGYEGVVITDDLGAGAITGAGFDEGRAAVASARAGADLLLFALSDGEEAATTLTRSLRRGELDERSLIASCARVNVLRESLDQPGG